jgi:SAM-dependent methyltransferase
VLSATRRGDAVLDLGSVGSAMLPALRRLGYVDLHGIDLDPAVAEMPEADSIDYRVGDMMRAPWADESFAAITAISVIEHGLHTERLVREVRRLLRPGGIFVFSTDFWPKKIDTEGLSAFGLPWTIFDVEEISGFFAVAHEAGLRLEYPVQGIEIEPTSRPIEWNGRSYTFLHAVLTRE